MRYHYERPTEYQVTTGIMYKCNHPVYDYCTLYLIENRGLAVVQQRYVPIRKYTYWRDIDPWLVDDIFYQKGFMAYFNKHAGRLTDGLYPTVTVRQIMWALKMKPLKRYIWETAFDHHPF